MKHSSSGLFISFEGIEGSGKSTQARLLAEALRARGGDVVLSREPGGTAIGAAIRAVLLNPEHKNMAPVAELLLYGADRSQHLHEVVLPALARGSVVITDRYSDSTLAYQGYARGVDRAVLDTLDTLAAQGRKPDLTFLLDMDPEAGLQRNREARKVDRFELEALEFHRLVRQGFLEIQQQAPQRVKLVNATQDVAAAHAEILALTLELLGMLS